ncbi:MAG: hypothetical protein ACQET6_07595 [Bacillota bacterium]
MKMIRFLCLLLVIFSSLGMVGVFIEEPVVPIAVNNGAIFVLSLGIVVMANKRKI